MNYALPLHDSVSLRSIHGGRRCSFQNFRLASNGRPSLPLFASHSAVNSAQLGSFARASMESELGDYVIVHELLHFSVPNHGKLWKSLMCAPPGDYEKDQAVLNSLS